MGLLRRKGVAAAAIKVGGSKEDTAALLRAANAAGGASEGGATVSVAHVASASKLDWRGGGGGAADAADAALIGGTAWAFASDNLEGRVDVLFVDEAGPRRHNLGRPPPTCPDHRRPPSISADLRRPRLRRDSCHWRT